MFKILGRTKFKYPTFEAPNNVQFKELQKFYIIENK